MSPPESPRDEDQEDLTWTGGDAEEPQTVAPEPQPESEAQPAPEPRSRSTPPPGMEDWSAKPAASEGSGGGLLAAIKRKLGR